MIGLDRVEDLMVERALWGLSDEAGRKLALGCDQLGLVDDGSLGVTASVITGALIDVRCEVPPPSLLSRLRGDAIAHFTGELASHPRLLPRDASRRSAWGLAVVVTVALL